MNVIEAITAQQKGLEGTPTWMVGEQLKDICRREPESAALVEKDLQAITIADVAGKIKAKADEIHKTVHGNCICIPPNVAEGIIRKAYGLPDATEQPQQEAPAAPIEPPKQAAPVLLDLADFL